MSYKTWQEYWIQTGYGSTVGKLGVDGQIVTGTLDTAHPFNPSSPSKRYKLRQGVSPVWNEAGNIDPAVLNEWAAASNVKVETAAGPTEQQDLKYVADGNGRTWYEAVLRPWTIAREAGGGQVVKPVEEGDKVGAGDALGILVGLTSILDLVKGLKKGFDGLEDGALANLEHGLQLGLGNIGTDLRKLIDDQVTQHKAVMAELKQIKAFLQRLQPTKAAKS